MSFYGRVREVRLAQMREWQGRITPMPFEDRPYKEMNEKFHVIRSEKDWKKVEKMVKVNVGEFGLVTVDTEDQIGTQRTKPDRLEAVRLLLVGLVGGDCLTFRLDDLRREAQAKGHYTPEDLTSVLPQFIVGILEDRGVYKLGSQLGKDMLEDFEGFGICLESAFCSQLLHGAIEGTLFGKETEGHGLGRISHDLFGYDYKPFKQTDFVKRYGKHRYTRWPRHRNVHDLYNWRGELSEAQRSYLHLDATVPLTLVYRAVEYGLDNHLFAEQLVLGDERGLFRAVLASVQVTGEWTRTRRGGLQAVSVPLGIVTDPLVPYVSESEDVRSRARKSIGAESLYSVRGAGGEEVLTVTVEEDLSDHEEAPPDGIGEESFEVVSAVGLLDVPTSGGIIPVEVREEGPGNESGFCSMDLEVCDTEEALALEADLAETFAPYRPKVDGKRRRRGHSSFFIQKNRRYTRQNPYHLSPVLARHCSYCGASTHTKRDREGKAYCHEFRKQVASLKKNGALELACEYPLCRDQSSHKTKVCPVLAGRCAACSLRGHVDSATCHGLDDDGVTGLRDNFEKFASSHVLLKNRFDKPSWGFYNVGKALEGLDYAALLELSPSEAKELLNGRNSG